MPRKRPKSDFSEPEASAQVSLFAGGEMHVLDLTGPVTIGRSRRNKIRLRDDLISRQHCRIYPSDLGFRIDDLKSRNGTWLNGVRVKSSALKPGDVIDVGRCTLFFSLPEKESRFDIQIPLEELERTETLMGGSPTVMGVEAAESGRGNLVGVDELGSILRDRNNLIHLQQISKAINSEVDPDRLFKMIIDRATERTRARRGLLLLPEGGDFSIAVARTRQNETPPHK
ncbi:MAG: FHA domain-containing protein, partial [Planctomycetota bacterium]